jgi:VanZ family protein
MNSSPPAPTLDKPLGQDKRTSLRLWAAVLFVIAFAGVAWGSLTPHPPTVNMSHADKVQHFFAYAGLAALAFAAVRRRSLAAAGVVLLLGVGVEVAQVITDLGRSGSWLDALANTAGVGLVAALWGRRR